MPLRPLLAPPPEPPVVVPPFPTPAPPPPAREYIEWTPAGGPTLILSEHNYEGIMLGGGEAYPPIIGLDMPPQEEFDTLLIGGGELFNGRRWAARLISLPVVIHADSLDQLRLYRRQLMGSFNPALGDGVLTIAYPDGVRRHISARYSSGLDIAEIGRIGYPYTDVFSITLKARDPFPYGDLAVIAFDPPQSYQFFAPPGDTVNVFYISSANTTGDADVIIDGEVETWPEFVLGGPMTTAALRNRDSNKLLSLTPNLTVNQTLTVRMDPQTSPTRKFTRETGASVWAGVAGQFPVMWSLRPGLNRVTVNLAGTVPGQSFGELRYRPRYLSA